MTVERKISFKQCKCNLNGINHEEAIKYNNKEINRLRWSETFEIVRPAVIALMEENISITKCMDMDTSVLELLLKDFREISPIRRSSQLGLRKVHPDVLGNIKNKGAKRNPRELSKEKQRKRQKEKRREEEVTKKSIVELKKKIKKIQGITDDWRGKRHISKVEFLKKLQKQLDILEDKLEKYQNDKNDYLDL